MYSNLSDIWTRFLAAWIWLFIKIVQEIGIAFVSLLLDTMNQLRDSVRALLLKALLSPENVLEMQNLGPYLNLTESEFAF